MPRPTNLPNPSDPKTSKDDTRKVYEHVPKSDVQGVKTIIGGPDNTDAFYPSVRLSRWDGECWIEFTLQHNVGAFAETITDDGNGKLTFTHDLGVANFYALDDGELPATDGEGYGGFEFDGVLFSKPPGGQDIEISFDVTAQNCALLYQEDEATQIANGAEPGSISVPPDVAGSYAIYAVGNQSGRKYRTGKVGHLFRPKAIDNNGVETYLDFNADAQATGVLTITVPRTLLNSAAYPLVIDPTAGYSTKGFSTYNASLAFSAPVGGAWPHYDESPVFETDMVATVGHAWITGSGTAVDARFVIYDNGAATLANYDLIGQTDKSSISASADTTLDFPANIACPAGSAYIGGFVLNGAAWDHVKIYYDGDPNVGLWLHSTAVIDAMPATLASASKISRRYSIWWDYSVPAGGGRGLNVIGAEEGVSPSEGGTAAAVGGPPASGGKDPFVPSQG